VRACSLWLEDGGLAGLVLADQAGHVILNVQGLDVDEVAESFDLDLREDHRVPVSCRSGSGW
jgi:hypothetical protein